MERYSRHILLKEIGRQGQEKIMASKVLVIGAGGLGCPALQYLAAAGIGTLGIMDFDVVEESNLQRQVLFGTSTIGQNKARAAKKILQNLNPTIAINTYSQKLTSENAISLFKRYDIIVDGTDNFATRYLINDVSILTDKPFVYGAIYKFEGQVSVFNYLGGASYRCLFPTYPKEDMGINCDEVGVLGVLPGIIGLMQANEVLKIILGLGDILSGRLYCFDALSNKSRVIRISKKDDEIEKVLRSGISSEIYDCKLSLCKDITPKISLGEINKYDPVQFIDVRNFGEKPKVVCKKVLHIPLSVLEKNLGEISSDKKKVIFCKSGVRSREAVKIMKANNIKNCWLLKEGVFELTNAISKNTL